ncbi:MAG: hypothetical protein ACRC3Y_19270 [Romboutsia sp.]|uniref:hypothetical protein n=1 Tax=Romboutsia sp. TaxID=1965302 RepID=UPI003F38D21D
MKYFLLFLLCLLFIAPSAEKDKSLSTVIKDGFYNYITCLDTTVTHLAKNVPVFSKLAQASYEKAYNSIMDDRHLTKHLVSSGETLDDIIKSYNSDINDIENFRKVAYKENPGIISSDYQVQAGEYITVPSE